MLYPESCALSSGPGLVSLERILGAQALSHQAHSRNFLLEGGRRGLRSHKHSSGGRGWRPHEGACVPVEAQPEGTLGSSDDDSGVFFPAAGGRVWRPEKGLSGPRKHYLGWELEEETVSGMNKEGMTEVA